jgi:hypothetical protein
MTITLDIRPEIEAELARQAQLAGRELEPYAAELLEDAVQPEPAHRSAADEEILARLPAEMRALRTDEELLKIFSPNPAASRLPPAKPGLGKRLVEACASMGSLLTADEVDTIFRRQPGTDRPVEF